jgi:hypothetical protein
MSLSVSIPVAGPDQLLLRWSQPDGAGREVFVDFLSRQLSKIVVRTAFDVPANTPVYLSGKDYVVSGVASRCRKDANGFVLNIRIEQETRLQSRIDPGVFAVDNFLTEEQELEILKNLETGAAASPAHGSM